jgi:hypothetical protein
MFKLNGNNFGNMCVNEKMMFIEVVQNFNKCAQLKPENEATFSFNSNKIKPESSRTLKDLDIKENSIIEVTAKNIPINNAQNNQMNNNFPSMGTFQQGYQMSPQAGGMAQGMGGNATNTTGSSTNTSGTAGKTDNIGDDINWNIIFQGNGKIINVQATKDLKFSELATRFKNKAATNEVPTFFLNSAKIEENETSTLSQLGLHNNSKIEVVFQNSVIGAYY